MTIDDVVRVREEVKTVDDRLVHLVAIADISPSTHNPRRAFDGIAELAASLAEHGLLQPIVVRHIGPQSYELIAGHRRLEAARTLGWTEIAAAVRDETQETAYILTLVENLQRDDLTPKEEAAALEVLVRERGWTTRQIGDAIKRSHVYVSRRLRVFDDEALAGPVLTGQLPVSTAEELLRATSEERPELVKRAIAETWGQTQARAAVLERNVPNAADRTRELISVAAQLEQLLDQVPVSVLSARSRAQLRRLHRRLAVLLPRLGG
jgi:ParB family transcriptional regulator, chromosome partitioning protein